MQSTTWECKECNYVNSDSMLNCDSCGCMRKRGKTRWRINDWTLRMTKKEAEEVKKELEKEGHIVEVRKVNHRDPFKYAVYSKI